LVFKVYKGLIEFAVPKKIIEITCCHVAIAGFGNHMAAPLLRFCLSDSKQEVCGSFIDAYSFIVLLVYLLNMF